jgi:putative transposase
MPRRLRHSLQGAAFHVMNRAIQQTVLFRTRADYDAFLAIVREGISKFKVRIIAYCVMPNHWHFVVLCDRIEDISNWLHWTTGTHAIRWNLFHGTRGRGAVYQSRFKAVPIQTETSLYRVCRYVERNALRSGLVAAAESWEFGSLYASCNNCYAIPLSSWPIVRPSNWIGFVNSPEDHLELDDLRQTLRRGQPIGEPAWQKAVAPFIGLSMKPIGRPKKIPDPFSTRTERRVHPSRSRR